MVAATQLAVRPRSEIQKYDVQRRHTEEPAL